MFKDQWKTTCSPPTCATSPRFSPRTPPCWKAAACSSGAPSPWPSSASGAATSPVPAGRTISQRQRVRPRTAQGPARKRQARKAAVHPLHQGRTGRARREHLRGRGHAHPPGPRWRPRAGLALGIYSNARDYAEKRGIIIADTSSSSAPYRTAARRSSSSSTKC